MPRLQPLPLHAFQLSTPQPLELCFPFLSHLQIITLEPEGLMPYGAVSNVSTAITRLKDIAGSLPWQGSRRSNKLQVIARINSLLMIVCDRPDLWKPEFLKELEALCNVSYECMT